MRKLAISTVAFLAMTGWASAHPHVFVSASVKLDRNEHGEFTTLHHHWVFDEIFSYTVIYDFDKNGDGTLDKAELEEVGKTIKTNIAEYDFFTATRTGTEVAPIFEPDVIEVFLKEDDSVEMRFSMNFETPVNAEKEPLRISASDPSFYVAFDFVDNAVEMAGTPCPHTVTTPDFDSLLTDSTTFSEAFFENPDKPALGDEFYSWIEVKCGAGS